MYKRQCPEEMEQRKADVLGIDIRAMKLGPLNYVPHVFVKSSQMGHKHRDRSNAASFEICAATKPLRSPGGCLSIRQHTRKVIQFAVLQSDSV